MIKPFIKNHLKICSILGLLIAGALLVHIVQYVNAADNLPGTDQDPLVSQSYVDAKISELQSKIIEAEKKLADSEKKITELTSNLNTSGSKTEVVELTKGQFIIGGAGTQFVLRGGEAKAVNGTGGGIGDLTSGSSVDIKNNSNVPINHLLLISRDDGRGLKISSEKAWVLVMGEYKLN